MPQHLEPGTLMEVQVQNRARNASRARLLLVVHAQTAPGGDWVLGGAFYTPLSDEAFQDLLP
jgi:hypothetical protein